MAVLNINLLLNTLNVSKTLLSQVHRFKNVKYLNNAQICYYGNEVTVQAAPLAVKKQKVSKAMKAYLDRAKDHDEFIKTQTLEYQIGKRHLANMMGEDPETFTQEDIDNAIEYLFPSGLYDKKARPMMKPPEEVFPGRKAAEFDETGRPHHSMFYTGKPNFFKMLYDIAEEINKLNDFEDRMIRKGLQPNPTLKIDNNGHEWMPKPQLEIKLVETIADIEYVNFKNAMERLLSLPYSYKCKDFINQYRKPLLDESKSAEIPEAKFDEKGRQYVTTYECSRKSSRGNITLRLPGSGEISINGKDITYFENIQPREQVIVICISIVQKFFFR